MFEFTADFSDLIDQVEQIRTELPDVKHRSLVSIGYRLVALEKQHFLQLTETGSSNGVTWPDPTSATLTKRRTLQRLGKLANADPEDIGRTTGRLAGSFRFVVKQDSVHVTNIDPKAGYFAAKRPLYPQTMPADWAAKAESILQRNLDQLSTSSLKGPTE